MDEKYVDYREYMAWRQTSENQERSLESGCQN